MGYSKTLELHVSYFASALLPLAAISCTKRSTKGGRKGGRKECGWFFNQEKEREDTYTHATKAKYRRI